MHVGNIEAITTQEEFIDFLHDFRKDLEAGEAYWQNPDLATFLDQMAFWMSDCMEGYFKRINEEMPQPSWRLFAELLFVGAIYE